MLHLVSKVVAASHENCKFPAIFNLGDSNSDTGGLSVSIGPTPWPNGETYFRVPAGRACDGRLIIDFMGTCICYLLSHISYYLPLQNRSTLQFFFMRSVYLAKGCIHCNVILSHIFNGQYINFFDQLQNSIGSGEPGIAVS